MGKLFSLFPKNKLNFIWRSQIFFVSLQREMKTNGINNQTIKMEERIDVMAFLPYVNGKHYPNYAYHSNVDALKEEFKEWLSLYHPSETENVDSLWVRFSYEYSAMLTF